MTVRTDVTNHATMGRLTGLLIFISIVLLVLAGLHYYLWARLIRDPHLTPPWGAIATATLVALAVSIPLSFFLRRTSSHALRLMAWPVYVWIGLMFLSVVILAGVDLLRLVDLLIRRVTHGQPMNPQRRELLARWVGGGALTLASLAGLGAMRSALAPVAVRRIEIPLRRLGREQDGITLAQLTDLHIGPTIGKDELEDVVRRTNALQADIIAITGDLVDGSVEELRNAVSPLQYLKAKHGVFFVTGNHEYFSGAAMWVEELTRLGIRVLRNERVPIQTGESAFYLAGVDDRSAARSSAAGHGEDLPKALQGRHLDWPVVLLAHQPRTVIEAAKFGVDLQLSGHTHGGQIWPFGALVRLQQPFLAGLGRHGETIIYVSRGTGYWGPPMRLFAPAEITHIVLRAANA